MNYAKIDQNTKQQINSQLEKKNIFTKIDFPNNEQNIEHEKNEFNLPIPIESTYNFIKQVFEFIKDIFIKIFGN